MTDTRQLSLTLPNDLLNHAEAVSQQLGLSQQQLVEIALQHYLADYAERSEANSEQRLINQGDVYWVQSSADSDIPHPHVIIQDNVLNHSRIHTVVACALTSNLKRASSPGNVLLDVEEANLTRQSVVEVSKVSSYPKSHLGDYIGTMSDHRIQQILAGIRLLQTSFFNR